MARLFACPGRDCPRRRRDASAPPGVHETLRAPGRPLEPETQRTLEQRLGHDFGAVRVHDDARAAASAAEVGASAYAVGPHVVFAAGRYRPGTGEGDALLAHELAHVVQQPAAEPGGELPVARADDPAEREATAVGDAVRRGEAPARVAAATRPALARRADHECDISKDEGFPVLRRGDLRDAVGVAQDDLNDVLVKIHKCLPDPACMAGLSPKAQNFMAEQVGMLLHDPIAVDCEFGLDTLHGTLAAQAFFFKDEAEWDGIIGPETWRGIDPFAPVPAPKLPPWDVIVPPGPPPAPITL